MDRHQINLSMVEKQRKHKKLTWLKKVKHWILGLKCLSKNTPAPTQPLRKRRKKQRKHRSDKASILEISKSFILLFKPKRRRRKKSLVKRIYRRWCNFTKNLAQWNQKLSTQKRRKKRRSKQYAVYEMSNQKRIK